MTAVDPFPRVCSCGNPTNVTGIDGAAICDWCSANGEDRPPPAEYAWAFETKPEALAERRPAPPDRHLEALLDLTRTVRNLEAEVARIRRKVIPPGPQLALAERSTRCGVCRGLGHNRRTCPHA